LRISTRLPSCTWRSEQPCHYKAKLSHHYLLCFEAVGQGRVSKIGIPRQGDTIKVKYNLAIPAEFIVMSQSHSIFIKMKEQP
jgi:hypothetical protein